MARGKHGTAAAQRRAKDAEVRMEALQREKAQMREQHQHEMQELRAEMDRLRGDFSRAVREAAAGQVLAAKDSAHRAIEQEQEKYRGRLKDGLLYLFENLRDDQLTFEGYQEFASILGITTGELLVWSGVEGLNHDKRRMRRNTANLHRQLKQDQSLRGVK